MADKEATVYIIDLDEQMGEKNNGREETDLDWAMRYVWDRITTTVGTGRKTALVGVIGMKTDDAYHTLDPEEYPHISILQPLQQLLMPQINELREEIQPSNCTAGDATGALVVAIQMITEKCKKLQYKREIVLVTNGLGEWETDDAGHLAEKLREDNIKLTVLGVDFDDAEYGFKEEDKSREKAQNEDLLRNLVDECAKTGSIYGTMAEAIEELGRPRTKVTRPVTSYKGLLMIGDVSNYDTAISIQIERYPKTRVNRPPTASTYVARMDLAPGESSTQSSATIHGEGVSSNANEHLAAVKMSRTYCVVDESIAGGKKEVEQEDLAKGFEYGRTAVFISESDLDVTKFESEPGMDIIGFVYKDKYERYLEMTDTNIIVAQKANEKAAMALSSLIHALHELDTFAVARLVEKEGKDPHIVLLAPFIEPDFECLIDCQLPFAEDMRGYRFPPLDRIVTISGKTLMQHRNLPNDDLVDAMSKYVDSMDLVTSESDSGAPVDDIPLEDAFSPALHRINHAIRHRAVHPTDPLPPIPDLLIKWSEQPAELLQQADAPIHALLKAADVKKVPPKQKGRKRARETEKPLSGLNVEALLHSEKRTKISAENAIPEFKQALAATDDVAAIKDAANQLGRIVHDYIRHSVGDSGYGRAIEAIRVLKDEMTELEEPGVFNGFLRELKGKVLGGELGGERRDLWYLVRANRLGLIHRGLSEVADVSEEEAKEFFKAK